MKIKMTGGAKYFKNVFLLLKYVWKFAPELFLIQTVMIVCQITVNVLVYVSMLKKVLDAIMQHADFAEVAVYILWVGAWQIISDLINNIYGNYVNKVAKLKIHKGVHNLIFEKVQKVDLEKYDNTEFYNDYIWALDKADTEVMNSCSNLFRLIADLGNAVALFSVTLLYDKILLLFVAVPMVFNVLLGNYISRLEYEYEQEDNILQRKREYSRRIFYLKDYAKELKLYPVANILRRNFGESVEQQKAACRKYGFRFVIAGTANDSLTSIFDYVLLCLYMAYRAIVQNAYTAGTCAAMINAVGNMSYALENVFKMIPRIKKNGMFAEKIFNILNYKGTIECFASGKSPEPFERLEFKGVSFRYPGNAVNSLTDISLSLEKGEKIAIVGMNGAGKTTLVKLLLRYYDVTEGAVLWNDMDIREYSTTDYRERFSSIFQDFQIYAVKMEENIRMDEVTETEKDRIQYALQCSGLGNLCRKLSSDITREFDADGLLLSGGQYQKLAIARAIYRNGEIVIMDETSSALDPISEAEINRTIMEQMKEKSMIIISHRLSTIKHVDKICFMEYGRILEMGTHEELMERDGKYAEMYRIQADQYMDV